MTAETESAPIFVTAAALAQQPHLRDYSHTFPCHLHFNGPGDAGFGVKRITMLLPQCAMLMVSPCGCGRSGTVVGVKDHFEERVFYYNMDDRDVVTGRYLSHLKEAGQLILQKMHPKAILICMTCIDSLMGTDLDGICRSLQKALKVPVTGCFMNPFVRDSDKAPAVKVQQAIARCLPQCSTEPGSVNLLGNFAPLDKRSELYTLLKSAGVTCVCQLATCQTYSDFLEMSSAEKNLVLHFQAEAAAADLRKRLGIPTVSLAPVYGPKRTAAEYQKLSRFLGVPFHTESFQAEAQQALSAFAAQHRGLRIAVGEAIIGSPLELAETFLEAGISVSFVFRNVLFPGDRAVLARLAAHFPNLPIYSGVHPTTRQFPQRLPAADLAVGLDAGYFMENAVSVGWSMQESHFGFELLTSLLQRMEETLAHPKPHRQQMSGSYLTV